jgi:IMP dehydrogenase
MVRAQPAVPAGPEIAMLPDTLREALTFDDVLLVPAWSEVLPRDVDVSTRLTPKIPLRIPLVSSAMDTVTEAATAIRMAREGGIGFLHKNLSVEHQAREVTRVKKAESGIVVDPVTIGPERRLEDALALMRQHRISGLPVVDGERRPVGILTNRDVRFERNLTQRVADVMTTKLITVGDNVGLEGAKELLHKNRIEKLLVVDDGGRLKGLITIKDIEQAEAHPLAAKDELGRLRVGAAVGVGGDREARIDALIAAGCDVICVDTAHGHSAGVIEAVRTTRMNFPRVQLVAGNVATGAATRALIEAGVDAVKVGVGPGSICTTRIVAGVGVPQLTAISDCVAAAAARPAACRSSPTAASSTRATSPRRSPPGVDTVMIGSAVRRHRRGARRDHPVPGPQLQVVPRHGLDRRDEAKARRIATSRTTSRRAQKLVPEGIEGRVPYKGPLRESIYQLVGGLRSSMGYVGCASIDAMRTKARSSSDLVSQGLRESHVHDVIITKEAPNYRVE